MVTFFMCVVWIGATSYLVAWMITVIGMQKSRIQIYKTQGTSKHENSLLLLLSD
jgi:hypothetical protein